MNIRGVPILLFLLLVVLGGCFKKSHTLRMATTTSVDNSGLLKVLLPVFEKKYNIKVHVISVGSGKALKLAENGDVDVVLVHDMEMEMEFIKKSFGVDRKALFYNYFVIVGPKEDPANIKNLKKAGDAFKEISKGKVTFVSRGDKSGTHQKELALWKEIGVYPNFPWYIETGQNMESTLIMADEKKAYCLTDKATYISCEDKIEPVILFEKDPSLKNIYSMIITNPSLHPHTKYKEAKLFMDWISSEEGKNLVNNFKKKEKVLFQTFD